MRKLAWAALGFAVACGLGEYVLPTNGLPYFAAALAISSLPALLIKKRYRRQAFIFLLFAALGTATWWLHYTRHVAPCEAMERQTVTLTAQVADYPERHADYERLDVTVIDGAPREKAILYLYTGSLLELEPGDIIRAEVRLSSAVIRQNRRVHYYTSQNQNLLGYIQPGTLTVTGTAENVWRFFPRRLSHAVGQMCDELLPADAAPFLKGLLTGDTADLEEDVRNYSAMRTAGVMHIVAVSGMHIFILTGFLQLALGKGRRTSLLCILIIWLFALMTGFRASVVRAAVMQTLYLLAPVADRESDGATCLGAALLLLLALNPMAVGGVGLQLSFACMAGMVLLLPKLMRWMNDHLPMHHRVVAYLAGNVACTISATAFSIPLVAVYFGEIPLFSLPANLLTLFIVEVSFAAGYVVCALGALFPVAGQALGAILAWPVRWCLAVYRAIAAIPFASLYIGTVQAVIFLVFVYLLAALWFILRKKRRPLRADIPLCLGVIGLCLVLNFQKLTIREGESVCTAVDVGQGECVVLADSDSTVMIDCGSISQSDAGDAAAHYLATIGRTRLDALILTHLHDDHADGVETLLYRIPVDTLILPAGADDSDGLLRPILDAAACRGTDVLLLEKEITASVGNMELSLLLPQPESGDRNERGTVVLAKLMGQKILIMGDAGEDAERVLLLNRLIPDVDVLIVGHHGSRTASGPLFLRAAQAETAIISVGYNNYGHPTEETLGRLSQYCGTVLRTDLDGTVTIKFNANGG